MAVYKKTEKGMNELLAPSNSINAKLVSVLILVDGVRESDEVNRLAQEGNLPLDGMEILFHGGFIDRKFKGTATPVNATPAIPAEPVQAVAATPARTLERFNALYGYMVEETKALLGLRGFLYQLRIERASTPLALKALIEPIAMGIEKKHSSDMARRFRLESERLAVAAIAERDL